MSRAIDIIRDPYNENVFLYKKKSITFSPGVTILVGCNGIGKTTLIQNIISNLKENNIPYIKFDNLTQGGDHARSKAGFEGDIDLLATSIISSEGENIVMNLGVFVSRLFNFIITGDNGSRFNELKKALFVDNTEDEEITSNERWILLDAIDSGLSIDNICDLKDLFKIILEDSIHQDKDIYIIASANEYELANGEECLDVLNGKYYNFKDYEDYKELIMKTRREKDNRIKCTDYKRNNEGGK